MLLTKLIIYMLIILILNKNQEFNNNLNIIRVIQIKLIIFIILRFNKKNLFKSAMNKFNNSLNKHKYSLMTFKKLFKID